jgi:hypothetical protein
MLQQESPLGLHPAAAAAMLGRPFDEQFARQFAAHEQLQRRMMEHALEHVYPRTPWVYMFQKRGRMVCFFVVVVVVARREEGKGGSNFSQKSVTSFMEAPSGV